MSEIEQLRKEVNELRERIARMESRNFVPLYGDAWTAHARSFMPSVFVDQTIPPGTITCRSE